MLINCVAYEEGRKRADVQRPEIKNYLARPGCFVWIAVVDPNEEELTELQDEFDLHPLAVEDARHGHQRPKIEEYGDELFMVLHMVEPAGEELRVGEVSIFTSPSGVLSIRNRTELGLQSVRTRCEREPELLRHGAGYVLYALMDKVVDRYFPLLDALETRLQAMGGRVFAEKSPRATIEAIYSLRQKLMTVKHAVGPLTEAVGRLFGGG